jgi:hypothetical protein
LFLDIYRCQTDYAVDENVSKGQHCWRKGAKRTTLLTKRCQTDNTADENVSNGLHSWREGVKRTTQLTRRCQTDNTADEKVSNGQHSWRDGSKSGVTSGTVTACPYRAPIYVGSYWSLLSFLCCVLQIVVCPFFLLVILLSHLWFKDSHYYFGIFKLVLELTYCLSMEEYIEALTNERKGGP